MKFTSSQYKLLEEVKNKKTISRKKIAELLELTPAAVTKTLEHLLEENIILEIAQGRSTGGRKPMELCLNTEWIGDILGISITPRKMIVSVGNVWGEIYSSYEEKFEFGEDFLNYLKKVIKKEYKKNKGRIKNISIVVTGLINSEKGEIIFSTHHKFKKIKLKEELEREFPEVKILIENDVRAMALSEKYFGKCGDTKNFVLVNVSEGIGGAIIVNNQLISGQGFIAGEIGHVIMDRNSLRKCSCGKRGCLEALASNSAIITRIESMIHLNNYSCLKEILKKNEKIVIADVIKAVEKRDFLTTKVTSEAMVIIAHSIDMIISMLNPEKIVLMGELFQDRFLMNVMNLELQKFTLDEQKYELIVSENLSKIHLYNPISVTRYNLFK